MNSKNSADRQLGFHVQLIESIYKNNKVLLSMYACGCVFLYLKIIPPNLLGSIIRVFQFEDNYIQ